MMSRRGSEVNKSQRSEANTGQRPGQTEDQGQRSSIGCNWLSSRSFFRVIGLSRLTKFNLFRLWKDVDIRREWIFVDREDKYCINGSELSWGIKLDNFGTSKDKGNSDMKIESGEKLSSLPLTSTDLPKIGLGAEKSTSFTCAKNTRKIFDKLRVCLLELPDNLKPEFRRMIELNGGKAELDLVRNKVDILLIEAADGDNYKTARMWGVACISREWISQSVIAAKLLPFEKFSLTEPCHSGKLLCPRCKTGSLKNLSYFYMYGNCLMGDSESDKKEENSQDIPEGTFLKTKSMSTPNLNQADNTGIASGKNHENELPSTSKKVAGRTKSANVPRKPSASKINRLKRKKSTRM